MHGALSAVAECATWFPELVKTKGDGMMSVNYLGLIAPLIEATKEQQALIEKQQTMIDEQNGTISDLRARIEALEAK